MPRPRQPDAATTGYMRAMAGVKVKSLAPGDLFTYEGETYRLTGVAGGVAQVALQGEYEGQDAPGEFKKFLGAIANLEIPGETLVEKAES